MKKYLFRRGVIIAFSLVLFLFGCGNSVQAHELFHNNGTGISVRWAHVTNRVAQVKINGDYLTNDYSSAYSATRYAWSNASSHVAVTQSSFSSSNIDYATATEASWPDLWPDEEQASWGLGICQSVTTDGVELEDYWDALNSSRQIRYASIVVTPYIGNFDNDTDMKFTLVHEMGHALGLGHPDDVLYLYSSDQSVMRQGKGFSYCTPRSHDINDLNYKY